MKKFIEYAQNLSFVAVFGYGLTLVVAHMVTNIIEVCP